MAEIHTIDLRYGAPRTTAAFVVATAGGPVLVETGPESTYETLREGLQDLGHEPGEVRHVLVTHIHLDHAGAAWSFAEMGATVHVHPEGLRHLRNPSRLLASAGRIFGEKTEEFWGKPRPVPTDRLRAVGGGEVLRLGGVEFEALETPGHANHHHAWRVGGALFTGDVGGVRIGAGPVFPPTPPPGLHVGAWRRSIARLRSLRADELYLTHFGRFTDAADHFDELEARLLDWDDWVGHRLRDGTTAAALAPEFQRYVSAILDRGGLGDRERREYELADPAWMNLMGLVLHHEKHPPANRTGRR